jgi:hypothetical protein
VSAAVSVVAALGVGASFAATPAQAAPSAWWSINTSVRPATLTPGGEGTIVAQAINVGDGCTAEPDEHGEQCSPGAKAVPTTVSIDLPEGLEVVESGGVPQVSFFTDPRTTGDFGPGSLLGKIGKYCSVAAGQVSCRTEAVAPFNKPEFAGTFGIPALAPYELLELKVKIKDTSLAANAPYAVKVEGGDAPAATRSRPLEVSSSLPSFGAEDFSLVPEEAGGSIATHSGSHPFQLTATFNLNQKREFIDPNGNGGAGGTVAVVEPAALARNLQFALPPGQIGNVRPVAQCTSAEFTTTLGGGPNLCPPETAIGVATVTIEEPVNLGLQTIPVPLFNLEPRRGEPARFGFVVVNTPVILDTSVRSGKGEDYGVTVSSSNITQAVNFIASDVTFWGTPGDPRHDSSRGWGCLARGRWRSIESGLTCPSSFGLGQTAFLTLPTNCSSPFAATATGLSWPNQMAPQGATLDPFTFDLGERFGLALGGCNQLPFDPEIEAAPTSDAATSPTGLGFDINVEDQGLESPEGFAESQLKKAVVTLPQGFTTNPSVAEGLKACSEAEFDAATVEPGTGCLEESKIGEVEIESPLVEPIVHGSLYVARQGENPNPTPQNPRGNLLTIYMVARNPDIGILVKQALRVTPDPVTGQLTTEVDNVPQLPFSRFHLAFRQGQRSPLITPPACGPYTIKAQLYPWSNPTVPVERQSSFQITQGPEGQGCPSGGVPPFHPNLEAGTLNNAAGTYSPFVTHITRKDSEQEITRFSIKLPTGVIAKLKGVSECSDASIAQAKSREVEGGGTVEQEHPSCPANSEVGHSTVGSGVGNVLAYAPGKLYLAGPYHGSPISLVSITAAKVGPFDLGTVVVRFALDVNHETAEVSVDGANSDPIPHIVDGIPIHLRDIRAYVDRPDFTLNPTSCAKKSTASTILGSGLNFASSSDDVPVTVSSPFQAADCASLGFKPKLALSLTGKKTHRGALPAFKAVLTYPKQGAYANIAKAQVTLPKSEFLEQGHLKNVCTRKVFETGANPGENCPANSIYGHARATTPLLEAPLEGPVYLRTGYGTKLPELAAALNGPQISITLAGKIDSVHKKGTEGSQIRNTFSVVPDAPVEKFTLELKGGKKGLLVNSTDVCKGTHKALAAFTGQNGKLDEYEPALKAQCGKGGKKGKKHGKSKGANKKAGH